MKQFELIDMFENLRFEEIYQPRQNEDDGIKAKTELWHLYILKFKVYDENHEPVVPSQDTVHAYRRSLRTFLRVRLKTNIFIGVHECAIFN